MAKRLEVEIVGLEESNGLQKLELFLLQTVDQKKLFVQRSSLVDAMPLF